MAPPQLLTERFVVDVLKKFVPAYWNVLVDTVVEFWETLLSSLATLDFLEALNGAVKALTRLPYLPFVAYIDSVGDALEANADFYRRFVVTGDKALRIVTRTLRETFLQASFIANDTVIDLLIQAFAVLVWRILTRSDIIRTLIRFGGIRSAEQLGRVMQGRALKALYEALIRVLLLAAALSFTLFGMLWVGLNWHKFFVKDALPQDSEIVHTGRREPFAHRKNLRPGPDR